MATKAMFAARVPFDEVALGARFFWRLLPYLRRPISLEQATAALHYRFERRRSEFLGLMQRAVFRRAASPYRELLRSAGCEFGDLERLVNQDDVEGALRHLYREGVYLSVDEFKGRQSVVRGSLSLRVHPGRFRNPFTSFHVAGGSSGSGGRATLVPIDLAWIRDRTVNTRLAIHGYGGDGWVNALWRVPGQAGMAEMLRYSGIGAPPRRWFSQVDPDAPGLHPRYIWSTRALVWGSRLARRPLPRPRFVPLENALPVAGWMAEVVASGCTPHLLTFPSSAVRVCQAASEARLDLSGSQFTVGGEPLTAGRRAVL